MLALVTPRASPIQEQGRKRLFQFTWRDCEIKPLRTRDDQSGNFQTSEAEKTQRTVQKLSMSEVCTVVCAASSNSW